MTEAEARRLLVGTVVIEGENPGRLGTVRGVNPHDGFYVDWSDGQRGWIDFKDAKNIEIW